MTYDHIWYWPGRHPERQGQRCRVLDRDPMNGIFVEFEDGYQVITSRYMVRKVQPLREVGAGRDLDVLVAERIMGATFELSRIDSRRGYWHFPNGRRCDEASLPEYSTILHHAWLVVERMRELDYSVLIEVEPHAPLVVTIRRAGRDRHHQWDGRAPEAICRAALAAFEEQR